MIVETVAEDGGSGRRFEGWQQCQGRAKVGLWTGGDGGRRGLERRWQRQRE
ncbi:unnamed protein product [Spirodela intermedia]|uniref:Uncharacterized protein n=1 Tax=Spirodela intermedia TaxID=51605 RepID=A0A811G7E1_SPIIN|nr:unnamed protein product [Spirodela intermedia]